MCGVCVVLCPLGALEAWLNDENIAMFVEREAIPQTIKSINVTQEMCKLDCGVECEKSCPRDAIKVAVQRENYQVQSNLACYVQ